MFSNMGLPGNDELEKSYHKSTTQMPACSVYGAAKCNLVTPSFGVI
jgi:hypothetical protein